MSWSEHLSKAKAHLKCSRLDDSLREVNEARFSTLYNAYNINLVQALRVGGDREYTVYDSRAAIYERQGKPKNALQDVKNVIRLAPTHWQGYARASRLFLAVRKFDEAATMADMALARLDSNDSLRRRKLEELKVEVLDHRRRQIYHFGKLPVEIITAIFEMVVASNWTRVLTIWAVSRHWHDVALNTPNLWSTLVLTKRHPARHAQRWIERSKGRIRELSLRSTLPHSTVNLDKLSWSHLRICRLENHNIVGYVGGESKLYKLSTLEDLHVQEASPICNALLSIPESKLRRLTWDGPRFSWDVLAANHRNLTSLEVRNSLIPPSLAEVMVVLESNPMLEQLIMVLDSSGPMSLASPPPLTLPNLHTLHLGNTPWVHFFTAVTTPSLETLRLSQIRRIGLVPLIDQRPKLISVALNSCIVSPTDLLVLLHSSPTLQSLELTRLDAVSSLVVEALVDHTGLESPICPVLDQLDISYCQDIKTAPIVALLNSRNPQAEPTVGPAGVDQELSAGAIQPLARIRTLKADGCPQIQANFIPWIRARVEIFSCVYLTRREASWRR